MYRTHGKPSLRKVRGPEHSIQSSTLTIDIALLYVAWKVQTIHFPSSETFHKSSFIVLKEVSNRFHFDHKPAASLASVNIFPALAPIPMAVIWFYNIKARNVLSEPPKHSIKTDNVWTGEESTSVHASQPKFSKSSSHLEMDYAQCALHCIAHWQIDHKMPYLSACLQAGLLDVWILGLATHDSEKSQW